MSIFSVTEFSVNNVANKPFRETNNLKYVFISLVSRSLVTIPLTGIVTTKIRNANRKFGYNSWTLFDKI